MRRVKHPKMVRPVDLALNTESALRQLQRQQAYFFWYGPAIYSLVYPGTYEKGE